jgi:hypothetical protein
MWATVACQALRNGKRLQLSYDGFTRVVDEARAAVEIDEKSEAPRTGYKRNAKPFRIIRCQI